MIKVRTTQVSRRPGLLAGVIASLEPPLALAARSGMTFADLSIEELLRKAR